MPWPEYPCYPCVKDPLRHAPEMFARYGRYGEADGYYWHTAGWNRITGRWYARCCAGHVKRGRAA